MNWNSFEKFLSLCTKHSIDLNNKNTNIAILILFICCLVIRLRRRRIVEGLDALMNVFLKLLSRKALYGFR